jgi:A/G-specific adenine glycosylase
MLQQTQVDRVRPRFEAFIERFPDLETLAGSEETAVLEEWSGLGYYRRARLLHGLARQVVDLGGRLPQSASELQRLPGIGPYTAAAVASLAFGERVPVLDGNVVRVGARVLTLDLDPRRAEGRSALQAWVDRLFGDQRPGEVNEALMELGAILCTPNAPSCSGCPLAGSCRARAQGSQKAYPPPRAGRGPERLLWVAACCIDRRGWWLLRRVSEGPILRGMWLPPVLEVGPEEDLLAVASRLVPIETSGPILGSAIRHSITHRRITVLPVMLTGDCSSAPDGDWRWADPLDPGVPTSSLLAKLATLSQPRLL